MKNNTALKPLALYVHVPFCVQKCLYCDFPSGTAAPQEKKLYVDALIRELEEWYPLIKDHYQIRSVFIGGGTPTCLPPEELLRLGEIIRHLTGRKTWLPDQMEYTIEANPGTITGEHVLAFQGMGVNRVSLGLQSAQDTELKALGRIHTWKDFLVSYHMLREAGIGNINVDLMADIPGQSPDSYRDTLEKVVSLKPEHISAYSLIVEPGTPFYEMQQRGQLQIPDEETDRQMYHSTKTFLRQQGYERYEISNYSIPGKECRHNKTYWELGEYLGVGLLASSCFNGYRFSGIPEMESYLKYNPKPEVRDIREILPERTETIFLTTRMQMEEFMFLGLRMCEGVSRQKFEERFQRKLEDVYGTVIDGLKKKRLLAENGNHDRIYLTDRGLDLSNAVMAEFLLPDEEENR